MMISAQRFSFTCRKCNRTRTAAFAVPWVVKKAEAAKKVGFRNTRWGPQCLGPCAEAVVHFADRERPIPKKCPGQYKNHHEDNQGLCHSCGILLDRQQWEEYAGLGVAAPSDRAGWSHK